MRVLAKTKAAGRISLHPDVLSFSSSLADIHALAEARARNKSDLHTGTGALPGERLGAAAEMWHAARARNDQGTTARRPHELLATPKAEIL